MTQQPPDPSTPPAHSSQEDAHLLPDSPVRSPPPRALSAASSFVSSPLNPSPATLNPFATHPHARSRPPSHADPARDSALTPSPSLLGLAIGTGTGTPLSTRGSMILYRLAADDDKGRDSPSSRDSLAPSHRALLPAKAPHPRASTLSALSARTSFAGMDPPDAKYIHAQSHRDSAFPTARGGLVAYEYDPALDELDPTDDEDLLHDPAARGRRRNTFPWRGLLNVSVLLLLVSGLLALFVFYPAFVFYRDRGRNNLIDGNIRINGTGKRMAFPLGRFVADPFVLQDRRRS